MTRQYTHRPGQQAVALGLALVATLVILSGVSTLSSQPPGGAMLVHTQSTAARA